MHGPGIIVRSISARSQPDKYGNEWQYNSRSDHHSKVACWGILLDLLETSKKLRTHAESGEVAFGLNHRMLDFKNNKPKDLDLVICTPGAGWPAAKSHRTLADLARKYSIVLDQDSLEVLSSLPHLREDAVGSVRLALEAKACMTAHQRALPRLHDELSSSHHTIHGASDAAVAVGLVMVNASSEFLSTIRNNYPLTELSPRISLHKQPKDTLIVLKKIEQLPRRTKPGEAGYDALGVVVVECRNDGSAVRLVSDSPAPTVGTNFHYDQLVHRAVQAYEGRFGAWKAVRVLATSSRSRRAPLSTQRAARAAAMRSKKDVRGRVRTALAGVGSAAGSGTGLAPLILIDTRRAAGRRAGCFVERKATGSWDLRFRRRQEEESG